MALVDRGAVSVFVTSTADGIAAELTLVRTAHNTYFLVGNTLEDIWHLREETAHSGAVMVSDLTSATTALALIGPDASKVLRSVRRGTLPAAGTYEVPLMAGDSGPSKAGGRQPEWGCRTGSAFGTPERSRSHRFISWSCNPLFR
jgi:dimethylglycine oxidase